MTPLQAELKGHLFRLWLPLTLACDISSWTLLTIVLTARARQET